jgi:hypothetical protein
MFNNLGVAMLLMVASGTAVRAELDSSMVVASSSVRRTDIPGHKCIEANLTVAELLKRPEQERNDIILGKLVALMRSLGATRENGHLKTAEMLKAHRRMYDALHEHFFNANARVAQGAPDPYLGLLLAFKRANPNALVDKVFMDHIRLVLSNATRRSKE